MLSRCIADVQQSTQNCIFACLSNGCVHCLTNSSTGFREALRKGRRIAGHLRAALLQWQDKLFIPMADPAIYPTVYFHLPANRADELEEQVTI
ncbi:hypothetical protein CN166_22180 [Sinorhizobium medicae]|nr:hypothetical protein CN166_22180 [Sinorhizobium medicae]RVJ72585.1 hypothetical protein CN167_20800 [Sinorhizobium medicae]